MVRKVSHTQDVVVSLEKFDGIPLSDFLKLKDLKPGMKIFLDCDCERRILLVGNCTPFAQPTDDDAGIGWDWNLWKNSKVVEVHYDQDSDKLLSPFDVKVMAEG